MTTVSTIDLYLGAIARGLGPILIVAGIVCVLVGAWGKREAFWDALDEYDNREDA